MSCNCEGKTINIGLGCCTPVLAPIENYYTKYQVDDIIEGLEISGGCCITEAEVDEKIASAKTQIEQEIPSLSGYATEQWVEDKHYITGVDLSNYALKSEIPVVPTSNTAFTNDAGYLTEHQSLSGYATEAFVSAYTYDKETIDEKVAGGGTFDPTQYYTKTATDALLNEKLDATAYTPTDLSNYYTKSETSGASEISTALNSKLDATAYTPTDLSNYYNKTETNNQISSATADMATQTWVTNQHYITGVDLSNYATKAEIPVVPTSNTAFTNDAGYLTEHQSLSAYSTTNEVNTLINQSVSGKVDTSTYTAYTATTQTTISSKADSSTLNNYLLKSKIWCGTQLEYDSIQNKDSETLYLIHE